MQQSLPKSFFDLLKKSKEYQTNISHDIIIETINSVSLNGIITGLNNYIYYIIDYVNCQYLTFTDAGLGGYSGGYIKDGGPLFAFNTMYSPEDFKVYNEKIFQDNLKILKENEVAETKRMVFSHNFRIKSKKGDFIHLCQRSKFLFDTNNKYPVGSAGIINDITDFKNDSKIIHTIENWITEENSIITKHNILRKVYFPNEAESLLSKREIEVLKWICEGYSSKQIADRLFISIHTINNHRKNMLEKTNCSNAAEILTYALRNGLL